MSENNKKPGLSPQEQARLKEQKKQSNAHKKELSKQKKEEAKHRKNLKRERKELRHSNGDYHFWEFNSTNYSQSKVLEVKIFLYVTIVFAVFSLFIPMVALSRMDSFWQSIVIIWPILLILYALFSRFFESILSNVKSRNVSLFSQRLLGIGYISLMFTYFFILLTLIITGANEVDFNASINPAVIESMTMLVIALIMALVLLIFKSIGVSWYGLRKESNYWDQKDGKSHKQKNLNHNNSDNNQNNNQNNYHNQNTNHNSYSNNYDNNQDYEDVMDVANYNAVRKPVKKYNFGENNLENVHYDQEIFEDEINLLEKNNLNEKVESWL